MAWIFRRSACWFGGPGLPETRNEDITKKLIREFKSMIGTRALEPNSRLPSERELAVRFGVSRGSLRQALKVLQIMGVIQQRVGDGTYLSEDSVAVLSEPVEFLCLMDEISYHELYETRLILEPELAALAAERADRQDIGAIRAAAEKMEDSVEDPRAYRKPDAEFHAAIAQAAGNRVCESVFRSFQKSLAESLGWTSKLSDRHEMAASHRRILEARDAEEARRQMKEHLIWGRDLVLLNERAAAKAGREKD